MEFVYGIDPSYKHCGLVKVKFEDKSLVKYKNVIPKVEETEDAEGRFLKQLYMVSEIVKWIPRKSFVVIEGYAFSKFSDKNKSDYKFKEMMGLLYNFLIARSCTLWWVSPKSTRHYIIGDTTIRKDLSQDEIEKRKAIKKKAKDIIVEFVNEYTGGIVVNRETYDEANKKQKVFFQDIADAFVSVKYFIDKELWNSYPCAEANNQYISLFEDLIKEIK